MDQRLSKLREVIGGLPPDVQGRLRAALSEAKAAGVEAKDVVGEDVNGEGEDNTRVQVMKFDKWDGKNIKSRRDLFNKDEWHEERPEIPDASATRLSNVAGDLEQRPDFLVTGDASEGWKIKDTATGEVITRHTMYGSPLENPLSEVIRFRAHPGKRTVVAIKGSVPSVDLCGGNPNGHKSAFWPNGQNLRDVHIVGVSKEQAVCGGIAMWSKFGMVDGVSIQNLALQNAGNGETPLSSGQYGEVGKLCVYGVDIKRSTEQGAGYNGLKWGFRLAARRHELDIRDVRIDPAAEWGGYINGVRNSYFSNVYCSGNGRGGFQFVARQETNDYPGIGNLILEDCVVENSIANGPGGGYDFTFVGHLGDVHARRCSSINGANGGFVCWTDVGHGAYIDREGYSTTRFFLEDPIVKAPNAKRSHISVSGCGFFQWTNNGAGVIDGNRYALELFPSFGGPIDNNMDRILIPRSSWSGWKSAAKVRYGYDRIGLEKILTDQEIDQLSSINV